MSAQCPECDASLSLNADVQPGELVVCPECGADLEVMRLDPVTLALAPMEEEDWGE